MKGLLCSILENKSIGNCSANGISSKVSKVVLCDPPAALADLGYVITGVPKIFAPTEDAPAVYIRKRVVFNKTYFHAVPADKVDQTKHWMMMGGCFITTSDSRFPFDYPIPLHDREEA